MRISATAFARLQDGQGRYALLVNKGRLERGKGRILSPIGGGLEVTPKGSWFIRGVDREHSVLREFGEELIAETRVLVPSDIEDAIEKLVGRHRYDAMTIRDVPEKNTAYLIEIYAVTLGNDAMDKLLAAARQPVETRWVYFVTENEITVGSTHDGVPIGPISRFVM